MNRVIGILAGFLGSDHCPVTMELHPDPSDPPRQNQEETKKEGCGEKGVVRGNVRASKVVETSLLTSIREKSKEGTKGEERGEDEGEEDLRGHENVSRGNAPFSKQANISKFPEPSATKLIASPLVDRAIPTSHVHQALHSSPKTAFGNTLSRDVDNDRVGRENTRLSIDNRAIDILAKEPKPTNYTSLSQSENIPYHAKKARREGEVIEGKVPDPKVMNSGGFFR